MAILFDDISRLITIEAPETEITCQELLNAIRQFEASNVGIDDPQVASAAGKEPLGGDVYVGITVTLYDWKVLFEARPGPDWVTCSIAGGNLVSLDSDGDFQSPIEPTAYVTATLTASSSATLQELGAIQYASFNGGVTVDVNSGYSGTTFPVGTPEQPVDNIIDALSIAGERGFERLYIHCSMQIDSGSDLDGFELVGKNHIVTHIGIQDSAQFAGGVVMNSTVSGILDGNIVIDGCVVKDLDYVYGHIHNSGLTGTITLAGGENAIFANCLCSDPDNKPIIDMGGSGQDLVITDYAGAITVKNSTGAANWCSVGLDAGFVTLASGITAGNFYVSGVGKVIDNSTSYTSLDTTSLLSNDVIADYVWDEATSGHTTAGTFGELLLDLIKLTGYKVTKSGDIITIYEADESTPWRQYNLASGGRVEV